MTPMIILKTVIPCDNAVNPQKYSIVIIELSPFNIILHIQFGEIVMHNKNSPIQLEGTL